MKTEKIPDIIRQIRKEKGWTVSDLAERCGVSPRTVEGWEQGRLPRAFNMIKIMQGYATKGG